VFVLSRAPATSSPAVVAPTRALPDGAVASSGGRGGEAAGADAGPAFALPDAAGFEVAPSAPATPAVPSVGPWGGRFVDPALPATAPMAFLGSETSAAAPKIVYPLDGSLHPTNLLDITVQWRQGAPGQNVYRLRFSNDRGSYDVFAPCSEPTCRYAMPEEAWRAIAGMNRDCDVRFTVAGAGGGPIAVSPPVLLHFSASRVEGGLYYWSTSLHGTYRLSLGQRKAVPFIAPQSASGCYGCHAVSRNGKRIAWTDMSTALAQFRAEELRLASTDAPDARTGGTTPSATMALDPEGARVLVSDAAGALTLRDATTGAALAQADAGTMGAGKGAFFPEWSPDGKTVALTVGPGRAVEIAFGFNVADADVALVPVADGKLGAPRVLVAHGTEIHYYPTWSPDGKWIVFCSAPAGTTTYNNPQARLRLIASAGGTIYELGRATQGAGHTASWPKLTPFSQLGGQLLFVTFSSQIEYGFVTGGAGKPQLWLAAIDLRRLAAGDPSWAPVWLPFQEVGENNHLPFWTEALGCRENADCGEAATCQAGACVPDRVVE
jgi:hypothetical protein